MKKNYEIRVAHHGHDLVGECPLWHPTEHKLYWVDTRRPAIQRLENDGSVTVWNMPTNIGSIVFRRNGNLIGALKNGFFEIDLSTGSLEIITDPEPNLPENRLNDGKCDAKGRFWCGSRDPTDTNPGGSLYRLNPDNSCKKMDSGFIVSNGMAFSPDGKTMVFGDSRGDTIWKYDLDPESGEIHNKRVYIKTDGVPWRVDGATFDSEGYYWCAMIGDGAVGRYDPDGRLDRVIRMPVTHPTMCNFGGPNLDILYVTSGTVFLNEVQKIQQPLAGSVFEVRGLGVTGVPEPFFGR